MRLKKSSTRALRSAVFEVLEERRLLASIAFNFGSQDVTPNNNGLDPTHIAGLVPQGNWNNLRNGSGTEPSGGGLTNIVDDAGANTTATVNWTGDGTWRVKDYPNPAAGDEEMGMSAVYDALQGQAQGQIPITVNNIPYSSYDVYVYMLNDNSNNPFVDISANGKIFYGLLQNDTAQLDANAGTAFNWTQITGKQKATTSQYPRNSGNYVKFSGLSGSQLNLLVKGGDDVEHGFTGPYNATISGLQIVQAPAAPATSIGLELAANDTIPGNNGVPVDHVAGVIPQSKWNNLRNGSGASGQVGQPGTIFDSEGGATTLSVAWTGQATWRINNVNAAAGDEEMAMSAVFDAPGGGPVTGEIPVTINNVPFSKYDVYVYVPGDNDTNLIDITANGQTFYGVWQPDQTQVDGNANTAWNWTQITGTNPSTTTGANPRNGGNFVKFSGLTGAQLNILVKGGQNLPDFQGPYTATLSGIQIVDASGAGAGSIAGNVFNDPNSNGIKDGPDSNIAGWTVYLDSDNDGVKDAGETSATTDASGNYSFTGLADATYRVRQVVQTGYRKTLPAQGTPGYDVVVTGGSAETGKNFGNTTNIFLAGTVFNDSNSNGVKDGAETGIQGVVVKINSPAGGSTIATRTTDATGFWRVQGLAAGSGEAVMTTPGGYTPTNPANGKYTGSASSGERLGNLNFGLHLNGAAPASFSATAILQGADSDSLLDALI